MQEQSLSEVEAAEKIETIYAEFNRIIHRDLCKITRSNGRYHLVKENDDLEPIGNGGFANVYRQKSTGLVVKKLKDDYLTDTGIRSRFKREYNITKSLQDTFGIIQVYTFDEGSSRGVNNNRLNSESVSEAEKVAVVFLIGLLSSLKL